MAQTSISIHVPFHDVDSTGRIHFTAMFRYMEIAESEQKEMPLPVAEGKMTMVAMDPKTGRAVPLPVELRSALVNA
jgi:acyl-CoA thioesterase FadM